MTLFTWIVRGIIVLVLLRLVLRALFGAGRGRPAAGPRPGPRTTERLGGTLVRDPQCGTYIPEASAVAHGHGRDKQHFCSTACRDAWVAAANRSGAKAG